VPPFPDGDVEFSEPLHPTSSHEAAKTRSSEKRHVAKTFPHRSLVAILIPFAMLPESSGVYGPPYAYRIGVLVPRHKSTLHLGPQPSPLQGRSK